MHTETGYGQTWIQYILERMWPRSRRDQTEPPKRRGWAADHDPPRLTPAGDPGPQITDLVISKLVEDAWDVFASLANEPFIVKPSIPILFFGDSERYFASPCKVVTLV